MKRTLLLSATAVLLATCYVACVGDDPAAGGGSADGGGVDGAKAPTAPTNVKAAADVPRGATVTFGAPVEGAPITRFTVRATPSGASIDVAGGATSAVVPDLMVGQSYTFTVSAANAAGTGPESAPTAPVTIIGAPPTPRKPSACPGDAEVSVFVPFAAGATAYNVYLSSTPGGAKPGATKVPGAVGRIVVDSLTNGAPYYAAVTSMLGNIESPPSPEVTVTPKAFKDIGDVLFAASFTNDALDMFDGYSTFATNTALPTRTIAGAATTISKPLYGSVFAWSATGEVYLVSNQNNRLLVFRDAGTLSGDVAPTRSIGGGATTLSTPESVVVDTLRNVLYVSNRANGIVRFDDACNVNGDATPGGTIAGGATALGPNTFQIALDEKRDRLYVANTKDVLVFDGASTVTGNIAPTKTFTVGPSTNDKLGVALDPKNDILYVGSTSNNSVYSIENVSTVASGAVAPTHTVTTLPDTQAAATLQVSNNRLYVAPDSATTISRWDDAKNAYMSAVSSRTKAQPGVFYTGFYYVQ